MKVENAVIKLNQMLPLKERQSRLDEDSLKVHRAILYSFVEKGRPPYTNELSGLLNGKDVTDIIKCVVDGAVVDILSGFTLKGDYIPAYSDSQDLVTYVLVVRKDFKVNPLYLEFLRAYQTAAAELNNPDTLAREVESYKHIKMTSEEVELWQTMKQRFVTP